MIDDETPEQALRSIQQARRSADQRVMTVGMAKVALSLVAGTCRDPRTALATAADVARHRAAQDYQGERERWAAIAHLLETAAMDTAVLTLARVLNPRPRPTVPSQRGSN